MTIEITNASIPGIWYANKIGRRFKATAKPGHKTHVYKNPLFTIHEQDYIVIKIKNPSPKTLCDRVLNILSESNLTITEIYRTWVKTYGQIEYGKIKNTVSHLKQFKRIEFMGDKKIGLYGQKQFVWKIKTIAA